MIREQDQRTALLIGEEALDKLKEAHVAVIGLGGVGGYALEALVRAGVGQITIVDFDRVQTTNINRQIIANHETIGQLKTDLFQDRIRKINPRMHLTVHSVFVNAQNQDVILSDPDYVLDAIDSVQSKVDLLEYCYENGKQVVSVFGAGRRQDPSQIRAGDISKSSVCPLARVVRKALRERGITRGIRCVWSEEEAHNPVQAEPAKTEDSQLGAIGSISYMPGIMGLWAAAELLRTIRTDCLHLPF